ncbi:MAG: hypothetical protein EBR51_02390 [Gammaproteobacteria bacterium]|jgi:serpin B|nr:hypothetical protein [Gammaproteobacteria bacterium]
MPAMLSPAGLAVLRARCDALRAAPRAAPPAAPPPGLAVSPVSVGVALSMLAAGAARDSATLRELRAALGHAALGDEATLRHKLRDRVRALADDGLFMANSLWLASAVDESTEPFVRECQLDFGAEVRPLAGKQPINEHVERATGGLVRGLLAQDPHSSVLLNVFALRLRWFSEFNAALSQDGAVFHAFDGDRRCRMMHKKEPRRLSVGRVRDCTVLLLAYADDGEDAHVEHEAMDDGHFRFCAVFVLPDREGPPALAEALEHVFGDISAAVASVAATTQRATVALPAFRVETGTVSLKSELQALGVRRAFASDEAELSRMAPGRAWVDDVLHSVVIDVDERGTVAAAATAVATTRGRSPPVVHVQIDRPFGFGVYDLHTEETLFVASVVDPVPPPR